jgi:hypothetical protein
MPPELMVQDSKEAFGAKKIKTKRECGQKWIDRNLVLMLLLLVLRILVSCVRVFRIMAGIYKHAVELDTVNVWTPF